MNLKQKILAVTFTAVVIIACVALVVFVRNRNQSGQSVQENSQATDQNYNNDNPEINAQLKALDELRKQDQNFVNQPQTDEEKQTVVQQQTQQPNDIRKAEVPKPLTRKQIDDQLKQLDAMRSASK